MKMALDILIPALPERLRQEDLQKAMRYTKKIVIEEGHSLPQMMHCWQIIIRHADIFYPYRSYFTPIMIQSITRLGLTSSCPLDQRQVAVGVADIIVEWGKKNIFDNECVLTFILNIILISFFRMVPSAEANTEKNV